MDQKATDYLHTSDVKIAVTLYRAAQYIEFLRDDDIGVQR